MNADEAETLIRCYRPGKPADGRTQKAVKFVGQNPELQKKLSEQIQFDEEIIDVIHYIKPPDDLRQKLNALSAEPLKEKTRLRRQVINPAVLTAIFGVLLIAGVVIFFVMEAMAKFPGREGVEKMLGNSAKMTGNELEFVSGTANQLGDWFYMRGFDGYEAPPEIAALPVVGSRVFRNEGRAVAQVAVGSAEALRCLVYEFRASDFGVQLPPDGDWVVMEKDGWAGAIRQRGDRCFLIAFRGTRGEMRDFLHSLPKK